MASPCADLGRGGYEQLHVGMRRNNRADIAAVKQCPAWLVGKVYLPLVERGAYVGVDGHTACKAANLLVPQNRIIKYAIGKATSRQSVRRIIGVALMQLHVPAHRAVKQARVQKRQPEMRRQCLCQRALARGSWPVNGDDHFATPASAGRVISALTMPNRAIAIQTTSKTIVGKLKFTVNEMVSNAAPRKFDALNHKAFICVVRLL